MTDKYTYGPGDFIPHDVLHVVTIDGVSLPLKVGSHVEIRREGDTILIDASPPRNAGAGHVFSIRSDGEIDGEISLLSLIWPGLKTKILGFGDQCAGLIVYTGIDND